MYRVTRAFDFYECGDIMAAADVTKQERAGNIPDLLRNGYIVEDYETAIEEAKQGELSTEVLREMAKDAGIRGYHNMKRETLLERLAGDEEE